MRRNVLLIAGFTLTELIIVVILAGILASIALPSYTGTRERTLDKEAVSSLRALRTANMKYYTKQEIFWPPLGGGWVSNITAINGNLSMSLSNASWAFQIHSIAAGQDFQARAQRAGRTWQIDKSFGDPACMGTCL
jgi:prepilin-type N-terminal cleavage/methylation domain-containing protein